MKLTPEQMDKRMDEHFGYEAANDLHGVLETLTEDAEHDIVGWPTGPTRGREKARHFYKALYADLEGEKATTLKRYYGDNFLIDETLWEGRAPGKPYGIEGKGRRVSFRLLHIVEFSEADGKMKKEQVWADMAAILQQLPQQP